MTLRYKACNKSTLANAYNVSLYTLQKWLLPIQNDIGEDSGNIFTPKQVAQIVKHLGLPEDLELISV